MSHALTCRLCDAPLEHLVVDLGLSPLCQNVIAPERAHLGEVFHPLQLWVCHSCWLAQVSEFAEPDEIFGDYRYFSSFSDSWLAHAEAYVEKMVDRLALDEHSKVVEVGSNDGYLLQYVVARGIPALGVDPAPTVAPLAKERGVETRTAFFGAEIARELVAEGHAADLVCGANVMAQVPDLNDFVSGLATLVKPTGTVTIEFPHLVTMIEHTEFDTIYHEHYSYFSLLTTQDLFARHGLTVTDVEELPTHGGSLRVYAQPTSSEPEVSQAVIELLARERSIGVDTPGWYDQFASDVERVRRDLLAFLFQAKLDGRRVVGYGAPGKGNTLLNHCGIRSDLIEFTVDRNPGKQGTLLPGSRIPVFTPDRIDQEKPDVVLILPWNLRKEIGAQLAHVREWGGELMVPIPRLEVVT